MKSRTKGSTNQRFDKPKVWRHSLEPIQEIMEQMVILGIMRGRENRYKAED